MADNNNQIKTVLVGMTGRIDSCVAAYLLKQQGHHVIAVSVMWLEGELENKLFPHWGISSLNEVKAICSHLEIPFYGVQGHDVFKDKIADRLVGARLSGEVFRPEAYYHQALIEVLLEKATLLKADLVATGHYAKVTKNQTTGQYSLFMANDIKYDQSFELSLLTQDQMSKLLFPLAEVRREQAKKIQQLFNFTVLPEVHPPSFLDQNALMKYIESSSASIFHKEGDVMNFREGATLGEHPGLHYYQLGQAKVVLKGGVSLDPNLKIVSIDGYNGNIFVDSESELSVDTIVLGELAIDSKWDVSRPFNVFVKLAFEETRIMATLILKNNKLAVLKLDSVYKGMIPSGEFAVLYDRGGTGARVIASSKIVEAGLASEKGIEVIPKSLQDDEDEMDEAERAKKEKLKKNDQGYQL